MTALQNFGANLSFTPRAFFVPETEADVLEILDAYRGRNIRVIGRLHSWSGAPAGEDVVLDLCRLNSVEATTMPEGVRARVGAGCQIKRVLEELERQANVTLPTLGLITEQAIAGAISTGTHGSGKHSLSHYMSEIRVATYDSATGEPVIRTITEGPELSAARCSLGCLGVIVSVGFLCGPPYNVEEHFERCDALDEVLTLEVSYPLQQFFLVPWNWKFWVQCRRETVAPRSLLASLYRLYFFATLDISFHVLLTFLQQYLRSRRLTKFFYRRVLPWTVIRGWKVVDRSQEMLIMEHELFRHIEIEVFITRSRLAESLGYVRGLLEWCDGDRSGLDETRQQQLRELGLSAELEAGCGAYLHHYPICVRRVQPDETWISMAAGGDEDWYALSFISYARPDERAGFFQFAELLARSMAGLFDARPHWGKWCPIEGETARRLYPELETFRTICDQADPDGRFRNAFVRQRIFGEAGQSRAENTGGLQPPVAGQ
ncbi:MAG TPA: D-arabinono-1,4-lactone oxidase [Planctomycetaceae bacterium]|nr:D-arabinono-1,4-lactone oxidase [Planctomycetaceae bacterium]